LGAGTGDGLGGFGVWQATFAQELARAGIEDAVRARHAAREDGNLNYPMLVALAF
jgi:hypothetical protein